MARQPIGFAPKEKEETTAIFVRVPTGEAEKLDRLSFELKRPKREIVGALLSAVDLRDGGVVLGRVDLPAEEHSGAGEVLTLAEAAELLRVDAGAVRLLAERGELPARLIDGEWRFARHAILAWLACRVDSRP